MLVVEVYRSQPTFRKASMSCSASSRLIGNPPPTLTATHAKPATVVGYSQSQSSIRYQPTSKARSAANGCPSAKTAPSKPNWKPATSKTDQKTASTASTSTPPEA